MTDLHDKEKGKIEFYDEVGDFRPIPNWFTKQLKSLKKKKMVVLWGTRWGRNTFYKLWKKSLEKPFKECPVHPLPKTMEWERKIKEPLNYLSRWIIKLQQESQKAQGYNAGEKQVVLMNLTKLKTELEVSRLILKEDVIPLIKKSLASSQDSFRRKVEMEIENMKTDDYETSCICDQCGNDRTNSTLNKVLAKLKTINL